MKERRSYLWVLLIVLSLVVFACGSADKTTSEATSKPDMPTGGGGGGGAAGEVTSYHIHSVKYEGGNSGPVNDEFTADVVLEPLSIHYVFGDGQKTTMEVIIVGGSMWTQVLGMAWVETQLTDIEEQLAQVTEPSASPLNMQEATPLEDNLTWLLGQPHLNIAKGSMTLSGDETINGIHCKKYVVNSVYSYTATMPAPLNATSTITFRDQGEIWVADKSGWPTFVVRSRLTEVTTTEVSGNSNSEILFMEQDVTDINSSDIKIEPPK